MNKTKIVFFGTPEFSATILKSVISDKSLAVSCVVTQPDKPVGREQIFTPSPVKILAQKHKILVFDYVDPTLILYNVAKVRPDLIIVAAFGKILPSKILKIPKFGCLGVHPSLLPRYRGPTPVSSAILNGEKETGITIFLLDEKIDHGPILAQGKIKLGSDETTPILKARLAELGGNLLIETVPKLIEGKIKPKPQSHKKAIHTKLLSKKDGFVPWKKIVLATQNQVRPPPLPLAPLQVERMIRAFAPWPGVWTEIKIKKKRLKILKAHLEKGRLLFDQVQFEGKKPISGEEFRRGYS